MNEREVIKQRFFLAIEALKRLERLNGITGFAKEYNLNYSNLFQIRANKRGIRAEWLVLLSRDFNISPAWLLLGRGDMFSPS